MKCQFIHPKTVCKNVQCNDKKCPHRHIKPCKNWSKNNCKFKNLCEYSHALNQNDSKDKTIVDNSSSKEEDNTIEEIVKNFEHSMNDSFLYSEENNS